MRILLINHYAGSPALGMEYRPYYMAKEWIKNGHKVTIVAASFSHLRQKQPLTKGVVTEETIDGIDYLWIKTPKYSGNGVKRVLNIFSFVTRLLIKSGKLSNRLKPDIVIASSTYPLDIFPAKLISHRSKASLVYEVHDLWPLSPRILGGMSAWHPFILVNQIAEDLSYKWADRVVSLLPLAKGHMVEHGMKNEKFLYVPNGIVRQEWENISGELPEEHTRTISDLKKRGKFLVCYAGAHGIANGLDNLIDSSLLIDNPNVHLIFVGNGPSKAALIEKVENLGLTNVSFLPAVSKALVPLLLKNVDALMLYLKKCELYKYGISLNKLFDYMMASKPIINVAEAANDPVAEAGCGITVNPDNPKHFAEALKYLAGLPEENREIMGRNGKEYVLKHHDYKDLAAVFLGGLTR